MTTLEANETVQHSNGTAGCNNTPAWPYCQATRVDTRDSAWLTLTTDNTNGGSGGVGTVLSNDVFSSSLGVVLEYDQRVYRTNNGSSGGSPAIQGGGDGIAVYLADGNAPNYGNPAIDTTPDEAGGFGAGLGYSAVSNDGSSWCAAQQGVAGGYLGVGFDVYGNYQKAEKESDFGQNQATNPATRPYSVALGNGDAFPSEAVVDRVKASRIPQSIGLRGSGVRYTTTPTCDASSPAGMEQAYGVTLIPEASNPGYVTFYSPLWYGGSVTDYRYQYQTSDSDGQPQWHNWYTPTLTERDGTTYLQALVPESAKPITRFAFQYRDTSQYREIQNPAGDSIVTGSGSFQALGTKTGGYRWLAGTGNLSSYPNPTTTSLVAANEAAINGAVIDNEFGDATDYRRVRVTLTPKPDGSREIKVYWTDKLDVGNDQCYASDGTLLTGRTADGTNDTCVNGSPVGTWSYDRSLPLTFKEVFSYDLTSDALQAVLPATFRIGVSASTGWAVNYHQIRNMRVTSAVDLAVQKKVQSVTGAEQQPSDTAWADDVSLRAGDFVAYQIQAWNNGPSNIDPAYPATLTDGLTGVPLQDGTTWTATAVGGDGADAQVCTEPNYETMSCTRWDTEVSGTGPLTAAAPLLWRSDALAVPTTGNTAPTTAPRVVLTVTGTLQGTAEPGTYENTAAVGANPTGGPQEDDLAFNADTARVSVIPRWTLTKAADPSSGSTVKAGETITYTVTANALAAGPAGDVDGVTITDSLAEVATHADFVQGSVRIDGESPADSVTVTEPSAGNGQTLTIAGLHLPGGTEVPITYKVRVKDPVDAPVSFRNVVVGALPGNPPVQCADATEDDYDVHCSTEHSTPPLLQVLKVGESIEGTVVPFEGSEWAIYRDSSGALGDTTAVVEFGPDPKTPQVSKGLFQTSIDPGTYWLVETKSLEGFSLLPAPVQFTVATDGAVTLAAGNGSHLTACPASPAGDLCPLIPDAYSSTPTIVVADIPVLALPESGGATSPTPYYLRGLLLVLVAASGLAAITIHRRTRAG